MKCYYIQIEAQRKHIHWIINANVSVNLSVSKSKPSKWNWMGIELAPLMVLEAENEANKWWN